MKNNIEIIEQEAFASTIQFKAKFIYNNITYWAQGVYYNGDRITDIEVFTADDDDEFYGPYTTTDAKVYEAGRQILYDMNLEKHLTY
tara:strand:- start:5756 stop:6016 length:261 start_codon:yes stop_codon:yes gene_type:complete